MSNFIVHPYTPEAYLDTNAFVKAVKVGVRTLDKLIDENYTRHPLKEQQEMSWNYRNIGLGIFGYATALMKCGYRYGSKEALAFTDDVFGLMFRAAVIESNNRSKELGCFPKYKDCVWDSDIIKYHFRQDEIDQMKEYGLRNCSLLSIAPNGSIATLLGESGGCEPEFAMKFTRRTVGMTDGHDTYYDVYCRGAREYMKTNNTDALPDYFVASHDIAWKDRVLTQAVMQRHIDTAISSTVNLPNSATKDDIANLYILAWESGLKGITIFRDGCKRMPILSTSEKNSEDSNVISSPTELPRGYIVTTTNDCIGKKRRLHTGCGVLHCTAFFDPVTGDLMETYLSKGSTGGCANFMVGLSRMISLAARAGCEIDSIIDQLDSCGVCPSYAVRRATKHDTSKGSCCPMAVGNALRDMWEEMQNELKDNEENLEVEEFTVHVDDVPVATIKKTVCPECGEPIRYEGGCISCPNCGYSKCD